MYKDIHLNNELNVYMKYKNNKTENYVLQSTYASGPLTRIYNGFLKKITSNFSTVDFISVVYF